jgi:hypothetical protein
MPWCEECARYFAPSGVRSDGTCPSCHRPIGELTAKNLDLKKLTDGQDKAPWHFKLLVGLLILYMGWRLIDLFL